jgi:hypothetical protein
MKTILIVGIGAGSPEHLTVQAINALNRADVLFVPDKGASKADLADLRREIIARYVTNPASRTVGYRVPKRDAANPDYGAGVHDWHEALAGIFNGLLEDVPDNGAAAFLVWGDPGLYDSTIRIVEKLRGEYAVEIIPGITSIQALTAAHRQAGAYHHRAQAGHGDGRHGGDARWPDGLSHCRSRTGYFLGCLSRHAGRNHHRGAAGRSAPADCRDPQDGAGKARLDHGYISAAQEGLRAVPPIAPIR